MPVRIEADFGTLAGRAARGFQETGDPKTAQPAAPRRLSPPFGEAADRFMLGDIVEIGHETAAIDLDAEAALVRKTADRIAPAQCDRIDPEPPRGQIDKALDQVIGLGLAGA